MQQQRGAQGPRPEVQDVTQGGQKPDGRQVGGGQVQEGKAGGRHSDAGGGREDLGEGGEEETTPEGLQGRRKPLRMTTAITTSILRAISDLKVSFLVGRALVAVEGGHQVIWQVSKIGHIWHA